MTFGEAKMILNQVCVWFIKKLVFPIVDIQISYGYLLFGIIYILLLLLIIINYYYY